MEEELLLMCAVVLAKREETAQMRNLPKKLRDENDPFAVQEQIFIKNFAFPKWLCRELIQELKPHDNQDSKLPFTFRFLASMYFYVRGSNQKCAGSKNPTLLSQSSVSRSLYHISKLIATVKRSEIKFPQTSEEIANTKNGFYRNFGMKGTVGAVDCTHFGIISPPSKEGCLLPRCRYKNRKGFYSINVEAVCDHRLLFTAVNAQFPGSCHDSSIWTTSPIRRHMMSNHTSKNDRWLLGGQEYPLEPWLLTPVTEPSNAREEKFNELHAKTRSSIERAFVVLRSRFRCLSKHRILHYDHERAANIIYTCTILHNILVKHGAATDIDEKEEVENSNDIVEMEESELLREARRIRTRYILSL